LSAPPPIYLDYNATTPVDPAVLDAMLPWLRAGFGNPSSQHAYGRPAHAAVEGARAEVAALIGARDDEIVFTGGGSEASNHALKGAAFAELQRDTPLAGAPADGAQPDGEPRRRQIAYSAVEHPATSVSAEALRPFGFTTSVVGVDRAGVIDLAALATALREPTLIVSVMHANNETGVVQPIAAVAAAARQAGALMHVDAAQSAGKIAVNVSALGADLLTLAGHKLYAPKGVGALYIRGGVQLTPLIHGAGHESGRRAGTENVPYIVGLGAACRIAAQGLAAHAAHMRSLRDRLWAQLSAGLGDQVVQNGVPAERLPNTLNVSFLGLIGADLLRAVPEIAASTGSACHDGKLSISPVLAAMGVDTRIAAGAVRLSLGRHTTAEEIERSAALLVERARGLR
jgi:cysteine desulfurase